MDAPIDRVRALERCTLFRALDHDERAQLAARAHHRRFPSGTYIFHAGEPGDSMMAVTLGVVRISLPAPGGRDIIIADFPAGEVFGEIAMLDGQGRSADAIALTNVELLAIDRRDAVQFIAARPEVGMRLLALVCSKLRASDERAADMAFSDLSARLAKALLRRIVSSTGSPPRPRVSLSQGEIARIVGASREAVNRQLSAWQRRGLIEVHDGWIVLLRNEEIAGIAGFL